MVGFGSRQSFTLVSRSGRIVAERPPVHMDHKLSDRAGLDRQPAAMTAKLVLWVTAEHRAVITGSHLDA